MLFRVSHFKKAQVKFKSTERRAYFVAVSVASKYKKHIFLALIVRAGYISEDTLYRKEKYDRLFSSEPKEGTHTF